MRFSDFLDKRPSKRNASQDGFSKSSLAAVALGRTPEEVDERRRLLLRSLVLGGGAFIAYKSLSLLTDFIEGGAVNEHLFENFRVVETGTSLTFYDRITGAEILVLDK